MASRRTLTAAVIGALALAGCSSSGSVGGGDRPAAGALAPAPAPIYAPGDTFVYDDGGTVTEERVVSVSPDRVVWTNDRGLIWTKDTALVTPPLSWSDDPELGRGRQTILGSPQQLFPLQEGNAIAYSVRGSSENAPAGWQDEHRCVVAGQEDVEVKAGRYTAFRIDCQRKDYVDTYFYSPIVQNYALRLRQFGNRQVRKELISANLANDRTAGLPAAVPVPPVAGAPVSAPTPPMPAIDESGKPAEPGMTAPADQAKATTLVARLEDVVTRLEKLAGMEPGSTPARTSAAAKPPAARSAPTGGAAGGGGAGGSWAVHLASYRSQKAASDGWKVLQNRFPQLKDKTMRTSEFAGGGGGGTYIRLLAAGFPNQTAATDFCRPLVAQGQFCQGKGPLP